MFLNYVISSVLKNGLKFDVKIVSPMLKVRPGECAL